MAYLYRHSLELLLKACIFQVVTDINDRKTIIRDVCHDLEKAFKKLIDLRKIEKDECIEWVTKYFADISYRDKESDMFRYPVGSNFKTFVDRQYYISLIAIAENMNFAFRLVKDIYDFDGYIFLSEDQISFPPELIIEGDEYYECSVVGPRYKIPCNSFSPFFVSYSQVGDFLSAQILEESRLNLFLPMCYLYRNAIELSLKRIIIEPE